MTRVLELKGVPLAVSGLSKRFDAVWALNPLDLEIGSGELVAFLGPSGCGKTTTLLLIAGIYQPTSGRIFFGDAQVDHLHPRDRDVGMVFQSYALYPHFTLFDNIAFPLTIQRMATTEIRQRVQGVADMLGIGDILLRRPSQVSGGQQQRAALARALVKQPQLLLLDEPLSNLDAQIRLQARGEIRRLQRQMGITSVLVTHDQAEALAMADRVAVFREGRLEQYATPHDLYHEPVNTFVAGFVGHPPMNLLEGRFEDGTFVTRGLRLPLPAPVAPQDGVLGIRPETVRLDADGALTGEVVIAEALGREALLTVELEAGTQLKILVVEAEAVAPGTRVALDLGQAHLHYFGAQGRRIDA
jgi:inositol-phosphate transport system ATP-binding protein